MKSIIPPSNNRVRTCTSDKINDKIRNRTIENINRFLDAEDKDMLDRIYKLNKEWDTERVLEANASAIILISSILGLLFSVYWFIATGIISFFLLVHAVTGWCPPLPIIRRMGVRSPEEIYEEKTALKYIRGDFEDKLTDGEEILKMIKKENKEQK